jgi:hypothetical protein
MAVCNLNRETRFRQYPLKAKINNLSVSLWRYLDIKAKLPKERCPERKIILEEENIRDPNCLARVAVPPLLLLLAKGGMGG